MISILEIAEHPEGVVQELRKLRVRLICIRLQELLCFTEHAWPQCYTSLIFHCESLSQAYISARPLVALNSVCYHDCDRLEQLLTIDEELLVSYHNHTIRGTAQSNKNIKN